VFEELSKGEKMIKEVGTDIGSLAPQVD